MRPVSVYRFDGKYTIPNRERNRFLKFSAVGREHWSTIEGQGNDIFRRPMYYDGRGRDGRGDRLNKRDYRTRNEVTCLKESVRNNKKYDTQSAHTPQYEGE